MAEAEELVGLEVSCPTCGKMGQMSFALTENMAHDDFYKVFEALGMDEHYTLRGKMYCPECDRIVVGCITISSSSL